MTTDDDAHIASLLNEARQLGLLLAELRRVTTETAQRRGEVLGELVAAGMSYRAIGHALGFSGAVAFRLAQSARGGAEDHQVGEG